MPTIIPPGGTPPPSTVPGPAPTGPVLGLPAVIPGGATGSNASASITGGIPPPPFTKPFDGVSGGATDPNGVLLHIYRWNADENAWNAITWFQEGWQFWPAGYYASSHQDVDGNVDWGPHSSVFLVVERRDQLGNPQPYVIPDPSGNDGTAPSDQCPLGMALSGFDDAYFDPTVKMCNYLAPPPPPVCPDGTYWDPASETCKAYTLPIIPPIAPPPPDAPPVADQGGPDEQGDEITFELCRQLWAQTTAIINAIKGIGGSPGAGDDALDQLLINALVTLNATLDSFQKFLANLVAPEGDTNPDPVTCAQLTEQFDKLVKAITDGDASLADAIAHAPAPAADPNVKRIADVVNGADIDSAEGIALFNAYLKIAVDQLGFPADLAQLITT